MEWINKIWTTLQQIFSEGPGYIKENPKSGYLVVILILLVWLAGLILDWKWTYARPGSWGGNFWLDLLGPNGFRFWLGVIVVLAILLSAYLFSKLEPTLKTTINYVIRNRVFRPGKRTARSHCRHTDVGRGFGSFRQCEGGRIPVRQRA